MLTCGDVVGNGESSEFCLWSFIYLYFLLQMTFLDEVRSILACSWPRNVRLDKSNALR